ncbi:uncharacterized protein BP01DRAFT_381485 [Aspergillus saccharolyticus JOP 1030-1]|uniref:Uncharacterized protein n=1 Tax=Aspergillus saccharolyticus JOP 1030-1 TaxID=1450539 RepID=A0A318ZI32_9EURO|nr:hypothetical protein BP01DRAFT_381485 [Aspergillus saccharolyticus JOP 1030-1]PYH46427.1 hypothetical protein BP01DRAFT_381485 [Aspergillus saccharolyticus JOP 1030-1]
MQLKALLLALTASLAAADWIEYCPFAKDKSGMLQHPYCCDSYGPAPNTDLAMEGFGCQALADPAPSCPNGAAVACCYTINTQFICTADGVYEDD